MLPPTTSAIYVAGPHSAPTHEAITANVARALNAGARLASAGYFVIVPHAAVPPHLSWDEAMAICKGLLLTCHAIALLPGWNLSRGSRLERQWAQEAGISIFDYVDLCPQNAEQTSLIQSSLDTGLTAYKA